MKKNLGMFIVIKHIKTPIPRTDQCQITEVVEFVDRIKTRHQNEATAIVDYQNKSLVKSRDGTAAVDIIEYLNGKYPEKMKELDQMSNILRLMGDPEALKEYIEAMSATEEVAENIQTEEIKEPDVTE